jgi:cell division protein FtsQ
LAISISLPAERIHRPLTRRRSLLGFAVLLALGIGTLFLSRSSIVHARSIEVSGNARLSRGDVVARAGVSRATNVVWLDESSVERHLEADPWIAEADVRVTFPATIRIDLVERVPVAIASDGIARTLVAADGTPLGPPARTRGLPRIELPVTSVVDARPPLGGAAPVLAGPRPSPSGAATAIGAMRPQVRASIVSVGVGADGTLDLRLEGGVTVRFGSAADPAAKARTLARILAWAEASGAEIAHVDVAAPLAPAVRLAR